LQKQFDLLSLICSFHDEYLVSLDKSGQTIFPFVSY